MVAALTILVILGISIERFVSFKEDFVNITLRNNKLYKCNNWRCTNDFIFTVVLVLNIGIYVYVVLIFLLHILACCHQKLETRTVVTFIGV